MIKKTINIGPFLLVLVIGAVIWLTSGMTSAFLFGGLYYALMWVNVTATVIGNSLNGQETDKSNVYVRWKYIILASVFLSIAI